MEIALIISLIALAVALQGCIADSLTVIEKIRTRRTNRALLKKATKSNVVSIYSNLITEQLRGFFKKIASPRPTAELPKFHLDHIRPYSLGGTDSVSNLAFVCPSCHFKKICAVS